MWCIPSLGSSLLRWFLDIFFWPCSSSRERFKEWSAEKSTQIGLKNTMIAGTLKCRQAAIESNRVSDVISNRISQGAGSKASWHFFLKCADLVDSAGANVG